MPRPQQKPAHRYHHGDLRQALLDVAVRTIQQKGVEYLTLRSAGAELGVSRTALYRHFADKQALLAAVSREGFRMLRETTHDAWESRGRGRPGFEAMGHAYFHFAVTHPSHYRVMFGSFIDSCDRDESLIEEASGAFQVLVDALVELQQSGLARKDEPAILARFVWSVVHGVAMLAIDGQLGPAAADGEILSAYAIERLRSAVAA
jgi:AcrR family transcriptional regulator